MSWNLGTHDYLTGGPTTFSPGNDPLGNPLPGTPLYVPGSYDPATGVGTPFPTIDGAVNSAPITTAGIFGGNNRVLLIVAALLVLWLVLRRG